jgi:NADH-quinone oxidoreductase subunit E
MRDPVTSIIRSHSGDRSQLVAILQDIQAEYNYLPQVALHKVSRKMGIPESQVYAMATFFRAFSLKERGKHIVNVCLGTACHVRGGTAVLDRVKTRLNIEPGQTTKDGKYTLETVNCMGACALGPVITVDGEYHGQMNSEKVDKLLGQD